jgi:hypothetical protein
LAGAGIYLFGTEHGRKQLKKAAVATRDIVESGSELLSEVVAKVRELHIASGAASDEVDNVLPRRKKLTLKQAVLAVCASARQPLTLDEIVRQLSARGLYLSSTKTLAARVKRVLRHLPDVSSSGDLWSMAPVPVGMG